MKTAFLVINYNDYKTTIELLQNIIKFKTIDKMLIVDNNSTDNSFNEIQKFIKENTLKNTSKNSFKKEFVEIIKTKTNKGYGAGINYGAKYLKKTIGDCYIVVSNADIIINKDEDIKTLVSTFDTNTAIVAPIIKEHNGINRGWKIPTPLQDSLLNIIYIHKYLRPKLLFYRDDYYETIKTDKIDKTDKTNKKDIVNVETVSGCFFVINSKYLEEVNYFDENIFLYYEENIIATKLKQINKQTKINTTVEVFHNHSVTIDKNINKIKKYKILKQSQMYFQKKYNHANIIERLLLFITNKITLLLLNIIYRIKK